MKWINDKYVPANVKQEFPGTFAKKRDAKKWFDK